MAGVTAGTNSVWLPVAKGCCGQALRRLQCSAIQSPATRCPATISGHSGNQRTADIDAAGPTRQSVSEPGPAWLG